MNSELKQKLMDFGALNYTNKKIALILDESLQVVNLNMKPGGDWLEVYERGREIFAYAVNQKLMEMAVSGDIKAIEKIEKMKQ
jgi:hypothetical protein